MMDEREKAREGGPRGEGALPQTVQDVESRVLERWFDLIEMLT